MHQVRYVISRAPPPQDVDSRKYIAKINIAVARLQELNDDAASLTLKGYKEYGGRYHFFSLSVINNS